MQFLEVDRGRAVVALDEQECDLIAQGCADGSTTENPSVSGDLATAFAAITVILGLSAKAKATE